MKVNFYSSKKKNFLSTKNTTITKRKKKRKKNGVNSVSHFYVQIIMAYSQVDTKWRPTTLMYSVDNTY